jgi:hypothetical protein
MAAQRDAVETPRPSRAGGAAALIGSAAVTWWLAEVWDPQQLAHLAVWVLLGLVFLPLSFAAALAAVGAVLVGVLGVLSVPAWLSGRPVGLKGVARDAWRLALGILPDYWRALRAVQKPWLWSAAAGFVAAVLARLLLVGLSPS